MIAANLFLLKASGKEKLKMAQPSFLISEEKNAKEKWEWKGTFQFDFYRTRVTSSLGLFTEYLTDWCYGGAMLVWNIWGSSLEYKITVNFWKFVTLADEDDSSKVSLCWSLLGLGGLVGVVSLIGWVGRWSGLSCGSGGLGEYSVLNDPKGISIGSTDFDTSIFDSLVILGI